MQIFHKIVQIYKHGLLMFENKNLNPMKIIDKGWGEWGDNRRGGRGEETTFLFYKQKSSIILFIFMIITVYYHGVPILKEIIFGL